MVKPVSASMYDVLIVGAGPAGSVLAYHLAKKGARILIIEKARLPRPKPCGGGITWKTAQSLPYDISPVIEIAAEGGIVAYKGVPLLKTSVQQPFAWLIERERFDTFLLEQAVNAGAELHEDTSLVELRQEKDRVVVTTGKTVYSSRYVAGADGVESLTARLNGLLTNRRAGAALEAEVSVGETEKSLQGNYATFDFGAIDHGYGWIFPKRDHLTIGVFHATPATIDLKQALNQFMRSQPVLKNCHLLNQRGQRIPLGGDRHPIQAGRVLLLGDAANLADAWLGEGLYGAIVSARIAAEELSGCLNGYTKDLSQYQSRIDQQIVNQLAAARRFADWVYRFPHAGSKLIQRSQAMRNLVFGAIRGDLPYTSCAGEFLRCLPAILLGR
ncbi:MAG TPA: geranylgeranyl reductase family protein [Anaerolineaceae bacterium]